MLRIRDNVWINLTIDGKEYPLEQGGFSNALITSSQDAFVPGLEINLYDSRQFFVRSVTLADGTPIVLQLGPDQNSFKTFAFRVFKFKQVNSQGTPMYQIKAYLDRPMWFHGSRVLPIRGLSSDVISQLASESNLTVELLDKTADQMIWYPKNERRCVFANRVCSMGYLNASSFMRLAVTAEGKIRYVNIDKYDPKSQYQMYVNGDPATGSMQYVDSRNLNKSGFNNIIGGYKHWIVEQNVLVPKAFDITKTVQAKYMTEKLNQAKQVKQMLDRSRLDFKPINCGNVHENYWKAEYQNARIAKTYSQGVMFMVQEITPTELLDPFMYKRIAAPGHTTLQEDRAMIGMYITTAKSIFVDQGNYYEKLQGFTTGMNDDPDNEDSQE
jgi:hypothetical protein